MAAQIVVPQPGTGSLSPPPGGASRAEQILVYAADFDALWPGTGAGTTFTAFANANPSKSPKQLANAYGVAITTRAVGSTIAKAVAAFGQNLAKLPEGATALPQIPSLNPLGGIASILSGLANPNFWLRVGEVIAGLILLGIGVNALFKGAPLKAVTGVAGAAAKVVP